MNKFGWSYPPGCSGPPEAADPSPESQEVHGLLEPFAVPPFGPDGLPIAMVDRVCEIVDRLAAQAEANKECPRCIEAAFAEQLEPRRSELSADYDRASVAWGVSDAHAKETGAMPADDTTDLERLLAEHHQAIAKMPSFDRLSAASIKSGTTLSVTLYRAAQELQTLRGMAHLMAEELAVRRGGTYLDELERARHIATIAKD